MVALRDFSFHQKLFFRHEKDNPIRFCAPTGAFRPEHKPRKPKPRTLLRGGGGGETPSALFSNVKLWLLTLLMALLVDLPGAAAQTGQRMSLHELSTSEKEKLAGLINNWLDENPSIVAEHKACFAEGIHSTNNFLPWHRVHIQQLEDYIRDNANASDFTAHIPNIKDESFRLPYWRPEEVPPTEQKIPTAFQVTFDPVNYPINTPQSDMNFNPDPAQYPEMGDFLDRLAQCENLDDAGFFSDFLEQKYHDNGHTAVGGRFNEGDAPACLIFWPWHAWIDDLWFDWENRCRGEYDLPPSTNHPLLTQTFTEYTSPTASWATGPNGMYVKGEVRIKNGATLTVQSGTFVHFRESSYNGFPTRIVVEPGGKLVVDGATLTGIDVFGNISNTGDTPGSKYYTPWEGVTVQGSPGNPGQALFINATVEHALKGVRAENGGLIYAINSNFRNNRIDVEARPHNGYQYASFFNCNFTNDQPMRDIVWMGSPLNAVGDCPGGTPEHHINHTRTHSTEAHIVLDGVRGAVSFHGCTIDNTFQDQHGNYMSRGIVAANSQYYVTQCSIRNQVIGISGRNTLPGPGNHVRVRFSTFDNNYEGISLFGVDNSVIDYTNTFKVPDVIPSGVAPDSLLSLPIPAPVAFGIYTEGASGLTVADNAFSSVGGASSANNYGAVLSNTGSGVITNTGNLAANMEKRNHFNGVGTASQAQGTNGNLQIRCNVYDQFQFGIAVTSGTLQNQGLCTSSPNTAAGNTWDNLNNCSGNESQVYKDFDAAMFAYRVNQLQVPTCRSAGVIPNQCITSANATSCDDPIIPCPRCEESRIAALETQKNALPPGDEQIQFIAHEQQLIYQQGVNERLENENEGLDVAITFTQNVEAVTSLWPGNKAALLLLKSEQEGAIVSGTAAAIAAIPEADPTKKWFALRYDLLTSGRTYSQLTATEKAMLEAEAEQQTKSGAHAKAIREIAYGVPARPNIQPIDGERNARPNPSVKPIDRLSIAPNPAKELAYVSFVAPEVSHQSWLTLSDLNGRVCRQIDLAGTFGEAQIPLSTAELPAGVYLLRLQLEGQPSEVKKLTVIR